MNVPWENAHGGALYCLIRGDEFSAWHRLLFQRPGCAESVLACRHFLDGSPVARCSYPEEYHPCVISRIALLCDSVGWTADVERISAWLNGLDRETYELVFAAIEVLEEEGPALGCPLVDTVRGSRHKNMKELRPGSQGRSEVRILFAFDPARQAIMLAAGNKAGRWTQWYDEKIKAADEMFAEHLAQFEDTKPKRRKRKKAQERVSGTMAMTLRDMDAVRPVNREAVDRHKARMRDEVRAFRLRELRAAQSLTQVQVAALAHIRQSRVSSIENGDIGSAQVNTLRKYVSALGGELDITVRLGDETFTLA